MVLNGAWDNNWGLVDDTRRGLEDLLDDLLCDAPPVEDGKTISTSFLNLIIGISVFVETFLLF